MKKKKKKKKDYELRVHEFDKSYGFKIVTDDTTEEEKEEQLGKATKAERDPTNLFMNLYEQDSEKTLQIYERKQI